MCFTLPYKILSIKKSKALIEGNRQVVIDKDMPVKKGDYLRVVGNVAVDYLLEKDGMKIRKLIKSVYL